MHYKARVKACTSEREPSDKPSLIPYMLPDGRVVSVSTGTSLPAIPYQLADGRVVVATRVRPE